MMLLVHPVDPTIKRLERLLKYVICHTDSSESLLIKPGDIYKKKALNELEKRSKEDFIVFLVMEGVMRCLVVRGQSGMQ